MAKFIPQQAGTLVQCTIIEHFLNLLTSKKEQVEDLVRRSYLNDEMKKLYLEFYYDKRKRLQTSYKKEYGIV